MPIGQLKTFRFHLPSTSGIQFTVISTYCNTLISEEN